MSIKIKLDINIEKIFDYFKIDKNVTFDQLKKIRNKKAHTLSVDKPENIHNEDAYKELNSNYDILISLMKSPLSKLYSLNPHRFKIDVLTDQEVKKEDLIFKNRKICNECNGRRFRKFFIHIYNTNCFNCQCKACKGLGIFRQKKGAIVNCYQCKGRGRNLKNNVICYNCFSLNCTVKEKVYNSLGDQKEICSVCCGEGSIKLDIFNPVIQKGALK